MQGHGNILPEPVPNIIDITFWDSYITVAEGHNTTKALYLKIENLIFQWEHNI